MGTSLPSGEFYFTANGHRINTEPVELKPVITTVYYNTFWSRVLLELGVLKSRILVMLGMYSMEDR
jgi:hypothetical protein